MKAIVTKGDKTISIKDVAVPTVGHNDILVKVIAVGVNPTDWKKLVSVQSAGITEELVCGCDYAGIVEEVGKDVPASLRKVGERVAGYLHGGVSKTFGGSFAEYCLADPYLAVSLPESVSFEGGATLGISGFTAYQALFQKHPDATPWKPLGEPKQILIWGGASVLGIYAIQLAKIAGYEVIATASAKNFDLLKSLGAAHVFDYRDKDIVEKIRSVTKNELAFAFDTISEAHTIVPVIHSVGQKGGVVSIVRAVGDANSLRSDVQLDFYLVYMLLGKPFDLPVRKEATPGFHDDGKLYAENLSKLLSEKKLVTSPTKILPNGLNSIQEALDLLENGQVSAGKLVVKIADTPGL
ncbi:GroES-like protein [Sistotremastrum niveocremeum HHB9708]|uniref:GroES-like protein n=1 Tax=Sistotremastrum niveocremeum HHB9708 TaxID=1314777 RepID=A0A165A9C3_9AGAM|nr:GroES-like protein [Sistotremastrum niveocremeum HHB9708]